jgi:hypothetical protein
MSIARAGAWALLFAFGVLSRIGGADELAGGNLLVNGDAEAHRCTADWTAQTPVPGWRVIRGAASVLCYDAFGWTGESPVLPSGAAAGRALFAGPGIDSAIEQTVEVRAAAKAIDGGTLEYQLSAWLGGWSDRSESALVTAVFLDDDGRSTGSPVVLGDPGANQRGHRTGLIARVTHGTIPVGTRRITVTVDLPSGLSSYQSAFADNISLTLGRGGADVQAQALLAPRSTIPLLDHVYVVMMENTNFADVVHTRSGSFSIDARMPFLDSLARGGVLLTDSWGTYHPSDENYVAMVAGDTYKYGPVYYPDYDLPVNHLADLLDAHGKTWRAYVQHMNTPCNLASDSNGGWYAPDDQPFAHFQDVIGDTRRCVAALRDLSDFETAITQNDLPDFAWIAADGWWDGEGAWYDNYDVGVSLRRQDEFLRSAFGALLSSPAWQQSRSLLIVTWDESLGWGWPDNHVATVLIGSPGLLREGSVVAAHYDGYGLLRTIEGALGLESLGRFDQFAQPLNEAFSAEKRHDRAPEQAALRPVESVTTRGSSADTFGRVAVPAAVTQGEPLRLTVPAGSSDESYVLIESLGRAPSATSARFGVDPKSGLATVRTGQLSPGAYGAWLQVGGELAAHAALPITILPASHVRPEAPGIEILGASESGSTASALTLREGGNLLLHYCRPDDASAGTTWIGVFALGTPGNQLTKDNANTIGFWLKTPGSDGTTQCGDAMAYASELAPGTTYEVLLLQDAVGGGSHPVGHAGRFTVKPALPH